MSALKKNRVFIINLVALVTKTEVKGLDHSFMN